MVPTSPCYLNQLDKCEPGLLNLVNLLGKLVKILVFSYTFPNRLGEPNAATRLSPCITILCFNKHNEFNVAMIIDMIQHEKKQPAS